ncbi:MAG: BlaI/MecI/CopY family transcriptional regulator [Bacteroidota bacterium]
MLVKKQFIGYNAYGKVHEYYPLVSKQEYFSNHLKSVIGNFFNGSATRFASFFTSNEELDFFLSRVPV